MDGGETPETRLPGRDNVVFGCAMLLLCICSSYCIFSDCTYDVVCLSYIWWCVYIPYAMLGRDGVLYMLDMWCCVHIVICA